MKRAEAEHRHDGIPNKLYFRIGEVSDIVGVKPYVLRYWESEFPDVKPTKSKSGQRLYKRRDVEMLLKIKELLYLEKFTINGARKRLKEPLLRQEVVEEVAAPPAPPLPEVKIADVPVPAPPILKKEVGLDEKRKTLIKVRKDLESLLKVVQTKVLQHNFS